MEVTQTAWCGPARVKASIPSRICVKTSILLFNQSAHTAWHFVSSSARKTSGPYMLEAATAPHHKTQAGASQPKLDLLTHTFLRCSKLISLRKTVSWIHFLLLFFFYKYGHSSPRSDTDSLEMILHLSMNDCGTINGSGTIHWSVPRVQCNMWLQCL